MDTGVTRTFSSARLNASTLSAVLLQLCITIPLAALLNLGQDDAYTMHTTSGSLSFAFWQAVRFEQNPPLYFIAMTLWRRLDASPFFATIPSVACAAAAVGLLPQVLKRYAPAVDARWVTFAVAVNPFLIWTALEIRVYSAIVLLSILLLIVFYDAFLIAVPERRAWWLYTMLAIMSGYTQYYLLFFICAQGTTLLFLRARRLPVFILSSIIAVVAIAPMLHVISGQLDQARSGLVPYRTPLGAFRILGQIVASYVLPARGWPHSHVLYTVAAIGIAATFSSAVVRKRLNGAPLLITTAIAFAILALAAYITQESLAVRHGAMLLVAAVCSMYAILSSLPEPARSRATAGYGIASIILSLGGLFVTYHAMAKPGDSQRTARYIEAHENGGQPILIFQAEMTVPFVYYYRGRNSIVPIPQGVDFHAYDVRRFALRDARQIDRVLDKVPHGSRIWLVETGECENGPLDYGCDVLNRYVANRLMPVRTATFYKASVRLLEIKPNEQTRR